MKYVLSFIFLCACLSLAYADQAKLTGVWYGESVDSLKWGDKQNISHFWIAWLNEDSTLKIVFYSCADNDLIQDQTHYGTWRYSGGYDINNIEFVEKEGKQERRQSYVNTYEIVELTNDRLVERNVQSGIVFESKKVDDDFMIECKNGTEFIS